MNKTSKESRGDSRHTALVLAGGGARGAYEAGVLLYTLDSLGKEVKAGFSLFSGTSVGALNTSLLASMADEPARSARILANFWRGLTMPRVLRFGFKNLISMGDMLLGRSAIPAIPFREIKRPPAGPHTPVAGFFQVPPAFEELREGIPWARLKSNLDRGIVKGIVLCATEVCSGQSVIFYQTAPGAKFRVKPDSPRQPIRTDIRVEHAMASSAIPFLFPCVQIGGACYTDGALHQNTPIGPAMRLGAKKLFVVSLILGPELANNKARIGCRRNPHPGALFLLGRMVNALMNESLEYEIRRIDMFDSLIQRGVQTYGPEFLGQINRSTEAFRNENYRIMTTCHIHPSEDPDALALDALRKAPHEIDIPGPSGAILKKLLFGRALVESDLLSYMLFTPTYLKSLIDLGYEDARSQRDKIKQFFTS